MRFRPFAASWLLFAAALLLFAATLSAASALSPNPSQREGDQNSLSRRERVGERVLTSLAPWERAGKRALTAPPTDQLIVRFHATADPPRSGAAINAVEARLSAAAGLPLTLLRPMSGEATVFRLPERMPTADVAAVARAVAALPEVAYAEPDAILRAVEPESEQWSVVRDQYSVDQYSVGQYSVFSGQYAIFSGRRSAVGGRATGVVSAVIPNDPAFADQWHYRYTPGSEEGINLPPAWAITTGAAEVVVAVIDTGVRPHADLDGRLLPGFDFIHDIAVANDGDGWDADPSDPGDWTDINQCEAGWPGTLSSWHGTHVAGTIGAAGDNGQDVAGVNWGAGILPVRVLGRCGGYTSDIADGARWAAGLPVGGAPPNPHPARVLNFSLGGPGTCGSLYRDLFNDLHAAGVVTVVAAGNRSSLADFYNPASCPHALTVAATTRAGDAAYYTNYGPVVELSAPGGETKPNAADGVLSTFNAGQTGPGDDALGYYQGTSMAAPHVAGVAALLLGELPALTPTQLTDVLRATARPFPDGSSCATWSCGAGIVDAFAALSTLDDRPPPELIAPDDGATLTTATPTFHWEAAVGAERYGLQVAADAEFTAVLIDKDVPTLAFTPAAALADGVYYWRAQSRAGAAAGEWSAARWFTIDTSGPDCPPPPAPDLLAPADGATLDAAPLLEWAEADGATRYAVTLADNAQLDTPLITAMTEAMTYTPAAPLPPGDYYWAVAGVNYIEGACDAAGPSSAVWRFTVAEAPPEYGLYLPAVLREN